MNARTVLREQSTIVGLQLTCPFSEMGTEIPNTWDKLKKKLVELRVHPTPDKIFGMYPQISDDSDPERCRYILGFEVYQPFEVPEDMVRIVLPSLWYASFRYQGALESYVDVAYGEVNSFIQQNGYEVNQNEYVLEVKNAANDLRDRTKAGQEIELMIPMK